MELWKDIIGYEGQYQVSSAGNVRSIDRINPKGAFCKGKIRKQNVNKATGYCQVTLCKNGVVKNKAVHRLVAEAFLENPYNKETVNHINENKQDNRVENLEWMDLPENLRYGTHDFRAKVNKPDQSGTNHPNYGKRGADANTNKGKVIAISKKDPSIVLEFDTAATASRELHISSGGICEAINGSAKSCGGYYWRRLGG